jgi:hypothetical protein
MLGELPHRLRRVREERGFGAQQPLVLGEGALVVAHRQAREEVDLHAFTLTRSRVTFTPRTAVAVSVLELDVDGLLGAPVDVVDSFVPLAGPQ